MKKPTKKSKSATSKSKIPTLTKKDIDAWNATFNGDGTLKKKPKVIKTIAELKKVLAGPVLDDSRFKTMKTSVVPDRESQRGFQPVGENEDTAMICERMVGELKTLQQELSQANAERRSLQHELEQARNTTRAAAMCTTGSSSLTVISGPTAVFRGMKPMTDEDAHLAETEQEALDHARELMALSHYDRHEDLAALAKEFPEYGELVANRVRVLEQLQGAATPGVDKHVDIDGKFTAPTVMSHGEREEQKAAVAESPVFTADLHRWHGHGLDVHLDRANPYLPVTIGEGFDTGRSELYMSVDAARALAHALLKAVELAGTPK